MNTSFEKHWKEKMEAAPPEEVVPGFDAAAGWEAVQSRLGKEGRVARWGVWIIGVALVMLCAIGVGVWISKEERSSVQEAKSIRAEISPQQSTPVVASPQPARPLDTLVSQQQLPSSPPAGVRVQEMASVQAEQEASNTVADTLDASLPAPTSDTSAQQSPVEKTSPKKESSPKQPAPVIVHLMDITGESGQRLRQPVEPLPARRVGFFARLLSRNKVPDLNSAATGDAVVQRTYLSR